MAEPPHHRPGGQARQPESYNGFAVASLVLSLMSLLLLVGFGVVGLLGSLLLFTPPALVCSVIACVQTLRTGQRGVGLAVAGFLLALPGWLVVAVLLW
ncbi:hypothetical protein [Streptomyces sp. N2A]|uniref:hypothetical protein n=1 Tax=Streptomyces sp. N2A TaxID=3073936 RepID=UPI0028706DA1|nr:hypothetical protein [Streptomyces sp. N2A]